LLALAELATQDQQTRIAWAIRGDNLERIFGGGAKDGLPERGSLGTRLRDSMQAGALEVYRGFRISAVSAGATQLRVSGLGRDGTTQHISSIDEIIVAYPFIEAISVQRLAHQLYLKNIPLIPRIMTEWAHARTGMDLHPGATIGTHFFVDHGTGTVIGETAVIGNHVKLYHGVTLGARSTSGGQQLRGKRRHPTIEDHVTIYPGATILGGEKVIGAGSTIGGNVFIMDSVAPNSLVIYDGLDMRVLSKADKNAVLDFQI
jgi:serine acetyltransferase